MSETIKSFIHGMDINEARKLKELQDLSWHATMNGSASSQYEIHTRIDAFIEQVIADKKKRMASYKKAGL